MQDRIEQAKKRIERDIDIVQKNFKQTLEQRGELTKKLHSLIVSFEEQRAKIDDEIYDVQLKEKHLRDQEMELKAQLRALESIS